MFKNTVKKYLKGSGFGRSLYPLVQKIYQSYATPVKRRRLQKYGHEALGQIEKVASEAQIPYFMSYGTLLGFIRDGGFIPHDDDIDLGILAESITPVEFLKVFLKKDTGFEFVRAMEYQEEITEVTLSYKKIVIDFFFYEKDGDNMRVTSYYWEPSVVYPSTRENNVRWIYQACVTELTRMRVKDIEVSIPVNSDELLQSQYGKNWRFPDPNWDNANHPGIVNRPDYGYSVNLNRVYELDVKSAD